jgi:hypothetical protein
MCCSGRLNHRSTVLNILNIFTVEERASALAALERLGIAQTACRWPAPFGRPAAARRHCPGLMQSPSMILADEPIASLDPLNAQIVMDALKDINEREGITVITNLHTLDTARAYCERVIGMAGGKVVFDGPPDELTTEAVRMIYGASGDGTEISEASPRHQFRPRPVVPAKPEIHRSAAAGASRQACSRRGRLARVTGSTHGIAGIPPVRTRSRSMFKKALLAAASFAAIIAVQPAGCRRPQGLPHRHSRWRKRSRPPAQLPVHDRKAAGRSRRGKGFAVPGRRL